jgi:cell division cycle 14
MWRSIDITRSQGELHYTGVSGKGKTCMHKLIVRHGDMNILGTFIPFASPIEKAWIKEAIVVTEHEDGRRTAVMRDIPRASVETLSPAFQCVLHMFRREKVGLVVRLNDEL